MIKTVLIGFLILLITSCDEKITRGVMPHNLIPKDTMVLVLKDLSILEAHAKLKDPNVLSNYKTMRKSGKIILDKFHLDTARFDQSMKYYSARQKVMQGLFSQVLDSVNRELTEMQTKK
jgi:hypothetical protein